MYIEGWNEAHYLVLIVAKRTSISTITMSTTTTRIDECNRGTAARVDVATITTPTTCLRWKFKCNTVVAEVRIIFITVVLYYSMWSSNHNMTYSNRCFVCSHSPFNRRQATGANSRRWRLFSHRNFQTHSCKCRDAEISVSRAILK